MVITNIAPNMASSPKTKVTFASLPREVRDKIYKNVLTDSKTINAAASPVDYGQPEDLRTLRATLHACRASPQFATEAFEVFFQINIFRIAADQSLGFLHRPLYYVKGEGFISMMVLVKEVEILLVTRQEIEKCKQRHQSMLRDCFRNLLTCPVLRRVTVKVGLNVDLIDERSNVPEDIIPFDCDSDMVDEILNSTTGVYQELKGKIGPGLKIETNNLCFRARIKAWEERMGKTAVEEM